jgi:hypothetical protein
MQSFHASKSVWHFAPLQRTDDTAAGQKHQRIDALPFGMSINGWNNLALFYTE